MFGRRTPVGYRAPTAMNSPSAVLAVALLAAACNVPTSAMPTPPMPFGTTRGGVPATAYTLSREHLKVRVTDYGATLVSVQVPDRAGAMKDVVLGFDDVGGYESDANQYFGCTVGRVANRIQKGTFTLDGYTYHLAINNVPNSLHGGAVRSFDKVMWYVERRDEHSITLAYNSADGEEGYPGTMTTRVTYSLPQDGELRIDYEATCDRDTPVNLTNHSYWNLAGEGSATVLDHEIQIAADEYTPVDDTLIPTGVIAAVKDTPLDLRYAQPIGAQIEALIPTATLGYDHNYVLREKGGLHPAATLHEPQSGRQLEILTTEPGLQFYSGNFLHGQRGKGGKVYALRSACCLETQHYPDSVNHANFPSTILRAGQTWRSTTVHHFSVR